MLLGTGMKQAKVHLCAAEVDLFGRACGMEKFTKWADKGTHINPFLPPRPPSKGGFAAKAVSGLLSLILFAIRLPFFIIGVLLVEASLLATFPPTWLCAGGALYYASEHGFLGPYQKVSGGLLAAGVSLFVLPSSRRLVGVLFVRTAIRFLLLVLGVSFSEQHANLRMLGLRPPGYKLPTTAVGATVKAGDVLISNHTSFLDVLYLASRFLPLFTAFSYGPQVNFQGLSLLGAIYNASTIPRRELPNGKTLLDLVKQARDEQRPLAIFPELARSNADAVLAFVDGAFAGLEESTSAVRTHVLGFSPGLEKAPMTCHTAGSAIWFLLQLLTTGRTVIKVTYVSAEDAPVLSLKSESKGILASLSRKSTGAWAEDLRSLLAQMISAKKLKVSLGYEDFVTFNQYYRAVQAGDIQTADQLAGARDKI